MGALSYARISTIYTISIISTSSAISIVSTISATSITSTIVDRWLQRCICISALPASSGHTSLSG